MTNHQTTQWPFVKAGVAGVVLRSCFKIIVSPETEVKN